MPHEMLPQVFDALPDQRLADMLARLEITAFPWPGWVFAKFGIWLAIGAAPALIHRVVPKARLWLVLVLLLGVPAAYLALYKPF